MNKLLRRVFLIIMLPWIAIACTISEFVWWLMEGEFDLREPFKFYRKAWNR